jgi:ribosomal protein S20
MPIKQAAIKDLRKNHKRAARNLRLKTHMKHLTRSLTDLVKEGKVAEAKTTLSALQQIIAKAAKNHVLETNNAKHKIANAYKLVGKK